MTTDTQTFADLTDQQLLVQILDHLVMTEGKKNPFGERVSVIRERLANPSSAEAIKATVDTLRTNLGGNLFTVLDLSTSHLPLADRETLEDFEGGPLHVRVGEYGYYLKVPEDPLLSDYPQIKEAFSTALFELLDFARDRGFWYINLDLDTDPVEGLPLYQDDEELER